MMASWDEQKELMGGGAGHGDAQGILRALLWSFLHENLSEVARRGNRGLSSC